MKKYAFLLSAALLLSGCAVDTEESSQQTTTEIQQTSSTTEQSSTAPTESEPVAEEKSYTPLSYIGLSCEEISAFDGEKIMSLLSFDIPVDISGSIAFEDYGIISTSDDGKRVIDISVTE